jgi:hypothetical protein
MAGNSFRVDPICTNIFAAGFCVIFPGNTAKCVIVFLVSVGVSTRARDCVCITTCTNFIGVVTHVDANVHTSFNTVIRYSCGTTGMGTSPTPNPTPSTSASAVVHIVFSFRGVGDGVCGRHSGAG